MQDVVWAEISTAALQNNFDFCKGLVSDAKVITVIKANGYGHGAYTIAKTLHESDYFAVARLSEALMLREQNVEQPIIVLSGILDAQDLQLCRQNNIDAVLHSTEICQLLALEKDTKTLNVWLKVDTGMHRLGIFPDDLARALSSLENNTSIHCHGLISHFSSADELGSSHNDKQKFQLEAVLKKHKVNAISFANSAALIHHHDAHYDYIRPGIMIYGVNPSADQLLGGKLKAVMTLKAKILNIRQIPVGDTVGYNGKWQAEKESCIATIAIGYADGYPRHAENGTPVLINGSYYPLAGRVSMDLITVDISDADNIAIGDEAILWGEGLPVERIAQCSGTIAYQLLTAVSERVPRRVF